MKNTTTMTGRKMAETAAGVLGGRGRQRRIPSAAEYHPSMKSADDLIEQADRELYTVKRGRREIPPA